MIDTLNKKVTSIATTYSRFQNFYKGYPIFTFQSGGGSMWYFAYVKDENNNVAVLDMENVNQNQSKNFINSSKEPNKDNPYITEEVQKSLDFMKRLLKV